MITAAVSGSATQFSLAAQAHMTGDSDKLLVFSARQHYAIARYTLLPLRLCVCHKGGSVANVEVIGSRNFHHRVAPWL